MATKKDYFLSSRRRRRRVSNRVSDVKKKNRKLRRYLQT